MALIGQSNSQTEREGNICMDLIFSCTSRLERENILASYTPADGILRLGYTRLKRQSCLLHGKEL